MVDDGRDVVKTGRVTAIRQLAYIPAREALTPVETMSFATLSRMNDGSTQRGDFHVIAAVLGGRGRVSIDFAEHPLSARDLVWIRPGVWCTNGSS
jgi:AraC family transcriptional activator of pobA